LSGPSIAFLYSGGTFTNIEFPGAISTGVGGINDAGQIVGSFSDTNNIAHGFLYSGGIYTQIDVPGGASGINDEGQVVGTYDVGTPTSGITQYGFIYNIHTDTYTTLNDPLATGGTFAIGINDKGQVVGYFNGAQGDQAFLYSDGVYTNLSPSISSFNIAVGINNAGEIVGFTQESSFLATPAAVDTTIKVGNGDGDTVVAPGDGSDITVGDGNNDTVSSGSNSTVTLGNGNDTIYVGSNNTVTVGTGHDSFIFEQTTPGNIGAATITGFDPNKDSFTFSNQLTTSVSYHDNAQGNAVVTVDNAGDTITLVGVHASELHPSDFHFVDPAAAVASSPSPAQHIADVHAHNFLL
jgi:probable HAF family extracellular repeat protein